MKEEVGGDCDAVGWLMGESHRLVRIRKAQTWGSPFQRKSQTLILGRIDVISDDILGGRITQVRGWKK